MAYVEAPVARRSTAIGLAVFGAASLAGGMLLGPRETLAGAAVFAAATLLAMRELVTPTITWPNAVSAFALVMWLVPARGYRLLARVPRLPGTVVDRLVDHFGTLQKLLAAGIDDLQAVEGVGESRARTVREGLSRLAESSILERYV